MDVEALDGAAPVPRDVGDAAADRDGARGRRVRALVDGPPERGVLGDLEIKVRGDGGVAPGLVQAPLNPAAVEEDLGPGAFFDGAARRAVRRGRPGDVAADVRGGLLRAEAVDEVVGRLDLGGVGVSERGGTTRGLANLTQALLGVSMAKPKKAVPRYGLNIQLESSEDLKQAINPKVIPLFLNPKPSSLHHTPYFLLPEPKP